MSPSLTKTAVRRTTKEAKPHCYTSVRLFSNEDLKKTLNKVLNSHNDASEQSSETETKEPSEGETSSSSTASESQNGPTLPQMPNISAAKVVNWIRDAVDIVRDNVELAYQEMVGDNKATTLKRRVEQADSFQRAKKNVGDEEDSTESADDESKEAGPSAIVVVKEPISAWQAMKERLQDSPLIREMLKNTRRVGKAASNTDIGRKAQEVGQSVQDKVEDAREFWETSQNPLVYTLSGVWENITGETEEGIAIGEIRKLDPMFNKEEWAEEVRTKLVPVVIKAHLQGDTKSLRPWLGEGVYNKLAAEIRARKGDGIKFDSNILDIEENQIVLRFLENGGPVIVVVYMVQQINCVRNKKDEIVEGGESEIRAKFYSMAFQQVYEEDEGAVEWKIVDYEFAGDIPYI